MSDCLFCRIIDGQIPSSKVYEDERVVAFNDIDKKAPVHILIIPKKHVASIEALGEEDFELVAHIMHVIQKLAVEQKLKNGFRVVANAGRDGGQTVDHLHFHLLGGRAMTWPPG
jgi:histidine triad (HIT) family protein